MIALIRKEWRENRWLFWAFVVLTPLLSLGLKHFLVGWERVRPDQTFTLLLPAMTALYLIAMGADLVAGDVGSGRIAFLAALPVRPAKLWAAKALFLFAGAGLFAGYVLAVETMIHSAAGIDLWAGFTEAQAAETGLLLAGVATLGTAVLYWSTLLDRGLVAVFAAVLTLAVAAGAIWFVFLSRFHFRHATPADVLLSPALLAGGLLLGSFLAFAKGRVHLGSRLRRFVLALGVLLVVVVPPGAAAAARLSSWATVSPADENVYLGVSPLVDPTGEWAVVTVYRSGRGPFGASADGRASGPELYGLYAIRLGNGQIRELTGLGSPRDFPEPGRLRLLREQEPDRKGDPPVRLETLVDLAIGEVIHTRPYDPAPSPATESGMRPGFLDGHYRMYRPCGDPIDLPSRWLPMAWGRIGFIATAVDGEPIFFGNDDRGIRLRAPRRSDFYLPSTATRPALALHVGRYRRLDSGRGYEQELEIREVPLDGTESTIRLRLRGMGTPKSPDGRRGAILDPAREEIVVLDADTGFHHLPAPAGEIRSWMSCGSWSADSERLLIPAGDAWAILHLSSSEPELRPVDLGVAPGRTAWFDGERALLLDDDCRRLWLVRPGAEPRRLLPTR